MIALPTPPSTANERSLANWKVERLTGVTGTTLDFANVIDPTAALLFKNGSLVDPDTYTATGTTVTVSVAAISSDVFVLYYHFRTG